jgi:hypothetical protein
MIHTKHRIKKTYIFELGLNGPMIKKTIVTNETANAVDVMRILSMNEKTCFESSVFSVLDKEV